VIPIDQPTAEVNLLVEDTTAVVTHPTLNRSAKKSSSAISSPTAPVRSAGDRVEIRLPRANFGRSCCCRIHCSARPGMVARCVGIAPETAAV